MRVAFGSAAAAHSLPSLATVVLIQSRVSRPTDGPLRHVS
jgi:hypothetical protein